MPRALTVKFCFQRSSTDKARRSTAYWICAAMKVRSSARRLVPGITKRYCGLSFETATSWPPQDEVQLVATRQPHAEERALRASRSMGHKRLTDLAWTVLVRCSACEVAAIERQQPFPMPLRRVAVID